MGLEFITDPTPVKARKPHRCSYCGCAIEKGEVYERTTLKYDEIYTWKSHLKCVELTKKLKMFDEVYDEGLTSYDFQEYIYYEFDKVCVNQGLEHYREESMPTPTFKEKLDFVYQYHSK